MPNERFYRFALLIDSVHKCINRLKVDIAPRCGVKSVHIFWIYELCAHPEGLTAAELASRSMISRSLISREIEELQKDGYIQMSETARGKRKNYNSRIVLTEKGKVLAGYITDEGIRVQNIACRGISHQDLVIFYTTLDKIYKNLCTVTIEQDSAEHYHSAG